MKDRLRKDLWVAYLGALTTWMFCLYKYLIVELQHGTLFAHAQNGRVYVTDFVNIYNAASLAKDCLMGPVAIYDPAVQAMSMAKLIAPVVLDKPFYTQYPPFLFALMRPLAELPMAPAWVICSLLLTCLLLLALKLLVFPVLPGTFSRVFVFIATLASYPQWQNIYIGSTAAWFCPLAILFWLTIRSRPIVAALLSSVSLIKLQYFPIIGLSGSILGRRRYVDTLTIAALLQIIAATATVGWDNVVAFPAALLNGETNTSLFGVAPEAFQNIRGQMVLLTGGDGTVTHIVSLIFFALGVIAAGLIWKNFSAAGRQADRQYKIRASITVLLLLITSPHTHSHEYVMAVLPCVWLWDQIVTHGESNAYIRKLAKAIIIAFPFLTWLFFFAQPFFQTIRCQPFFSWACLLCLLAVLELKASKAALSAADQSQSESTN